MHYNEEVGEMNKWYVVYKTKYDIVDNSSYYGVLVVVSLPILFIFVF